jgi:hypothetical protein
MIDVMFRDRRRFAATTEIVIRTIGMRALVSNPTNRFIASIAEDVVVVGEMLWRQVGKLVRVMDRDESMEGVNRGDVLQTSFALFSYQAFKSVTTVHQ